MKLPQITANVDSEETILRARRMALEEKKSLREWAGEKLMDAIKSARKIQKRADK